MPLVRRKVWNNGRKWVGNLLPALFFIPFAGLGIKWMLDKNSIFGPGLWLVVVGTVMGWIGLNLFGLYGNAFMRRELQRDLKARGCDFDVPHFFVGFTTPRFFNVLDAHEDIGFVFLHSEVLEFVGEAHTVKVPRHEITNIYFRPNIHTWVGLGRWISVEGARKDKKFRLSIEPREKNFLLLNLLSSKEIRGRLLSWAGKRG